MARFGPTCCRGYGCGRGPAAGWFCTRRGSVVPGDESDCGHPGTGPCEEIAPLVLEAYDLTEREAQVAQLVLQGVPTDEIAAALSISSLTVQQHLKAVFDKTGVRSRRDLVAQIFTRQYLPRILAGARLGADGWFAEPSASRPTSHNR